MDAPSPFSAHGLPLPRPVDSGSASAAPKPDTGSASPAFHVLLDQLDQQARALNTRSTELEQPEQLAGAVDAARDSLESALHLGDQLVEAYRASLQRGGPDEGGQP